MLVVDGDPASRHLLEHDLLGLGAEVITAPDGVAGLHALVDALLALDLLVTDLDMPGLDGLALVRMVRAEGGERDLPILVFSGWITAENRAALGALGAGVVEKGGGAETVAAAARRILSARGWSFASGRAARPA